MDKFKAFFTNQTDCVFASVSPGLAVDNNVMLQPNAIQVEDNKHLISTSEQAYASLDQCEQTSVNTMNQSMTNGIPSQQELQLFEAGYNFVQATNNVNTFQTEQNLDVMQEIRQLKTEMLAIKRENDQLRGSPFVQQPDTLRSEWQCMGCDSKTRKDLSIHEPILRLYCSMPCYNANKGKLQTRIVTIGNDSAEIAEIKKIFCSSVKGAEICMFARLEMPEAIVNKHNDYKKRFAEQNQISEKSVTQRMFHGTKIRCTNNLTHPEICKKIGSGELCKEACGLCGIIQYGVRTEFSRFGNSSPTISHSYCGISNPRAMFVVDVVATNHCKILTVNRNEATLPRYLILFQASRKRAASQNISSCTRIKRCKPPLAQPAKAVSKEQQLNFR
ncbi:2668_t:CDS:2 [Paraglomus brasilianum]|uniref:2668_t:CDS:1 n=1 Tax=Paraglomus brasilianum TaxID=144538 RepID=A0A9N8VUK5_9GLOM|nr:2668_t:CDS:2 [Paraglomus brasilianum]